MLKSTATISIFAYFVLWCPGTEDSHTYRTFYVVKYEDTIIDQSGSIFSDNRLTEDERSIICEKVIDETVPELMKCRKVKRGQFGKFDDPKSGHDSPNSVVDTFECPELPEIRVDVQEDENKDKFVNITIPPKYSSFLCDIRYKLKWTRRISEASASEPVTTRTESVDIRENDGTDRFTKEDRLRMCRDAFIVLSHTNIRWSKDARVGEVKSYELADENREDTENARAFQCSTRPAIFLTPPKLVDGRIFSRLVVEKKERDSAPALDRFAQKSRYTVKGVNGISDSNFIEDSSKFDRELILVPPEYDEKERRKICHEAAEVIPDGENLLDWSTNAPGEEKVYEIEIRNESGEIFPDVILAFECPTEPPFYPRPYTDADYRTSIAVFVRHEQFPAAGQEVVWESYLI